MKLLIIGGPGSGKTTYARKIARQTGIKICELDEIFWNNQHGQFCNVKRSVEERSQLLGEVLKHESWIIEGVYYKDWVNPAIEQADEIVVIKPPFIVRQYRILKRSLKRMVGLEGKTHKETLKSTYAMLKWSAEYEREFLPLFTEKLSKLGKQYKLIKSFSDN